MWAATNEITIYVLIISDDGQYININNHIIFDVRIMLAVITKILVTMLLSSPIKYNISGNVLITIAIIITISDNKSTKR